MTPSSLAPESPLSLQPFPSLPVSWSGELRSRLCLSGSRLEATFWAAGERGLLVPPLKAAQPSRCDGLWESTCFEVFLQPEGQEAYWEINVAPRGDWAMYAFDRYRHGMRNEVGVGRLASFALTIDGGPAISERVKGLRVEFALDIEPVLTAAAAVGACSLKVGVTAVLASGSERTYWALHHAGDKPDFHLSESFIHSFTLDPQT